MKRSHTQSQLTSYFQKGEKRIIGTAVAEPSTSRLAQDALSDASAGSSSSVQCPSAKQSCSLETNKKSKHRQGGFDQGWCQKYPWLLKLAAGMVCSICRKHVHGDGRNAKFVDNPSTNYREDVVVRHAKSDTHIRCNKAEQELRAGNTLPRAIAPLGDTEHWALEGCFRLMYQLMRQEIAHHTNYKPFLELMVACGCTYFEALKVGSNTNYCSRRIIDEILELIDESILLPLATELRDTPAWSVMVDEATDISITQELGICVMYIDSKGKVKTNFLDLVPVANGQGETIHAELVNTFLKHGINLNNLFSFASDGAAAMIGTKKGVATRLREQVPDLLSIHCIAHRLNLAISQAAAKTNYLDKFERQLKNLFWFYQNSPKRSNSLKSIQQLLEVPELKCQGGIETRWTSQQKAIDVLLQTIPAVITDLSQQALTDAVANGLHSFINTFKFVASLVVLGAVHTRLARCFKIFQKRNIFFKTANKELSATIASLRRLETRGVLKRETEEMFSEGGCLNFTGVQFTQDKWDDYIAEVVTPFIDNIVQNLEKRFPRLPLLEHFQIFDPNIVLAQLPQDPEFGMQHIESLGTAFRQINVRDALNEWEVFSIRITTDELKSKSMEDVFLALQTPEMRDLYPQLSKLAGIGLTIPLSTAEVERLFSTMKRVRTPLRNRLEKDHLSACIRISGFGTDPKETDFGQLVRSFYMRNPNRRVKCAKDDCEICKL